MLFYSLSTVLKFGALVQLRFSEEDAFRPYTIPVSTHLLAGKHVSSPRVDLTQCANSETLYLCCCRAPPWSKKVWRHCRCWFLQRCCSLHVRKDPLNSQVWNALLVVSLRQKRGRLPDVHQRLSLAHALVEVIDSIRTFPCRNPFKDMGLRLNFACRADAGSRLSLRRHGLDGFSTRPGHSSAR